ncbi:MAG: nitroreductase family protein [Candidatus Odinarchaeia archaeon]
MNDVLSTIVKRRSIRKYTSKEVEFDKLIQVLDAARWAPSSRNRQPWKFIVITDDKVKRQIASYSRYGEFLKDAPILVAFTTDPTLSKNFYKEDGALATQNFQLAAWSLGLGTCWIGTMEREKVKKILKIPENQHLLTVMPLGYFEEKPESTRKPLSELVYSEKYGKLLLTP